MRATLLLVGLGTALCAAGCGGSSSAGPPASASAPVSSSSSVPPTSAAPVTPLATPAPATTSALAGVPPGWTWTPAAVLATTEALAQLPPGYLAAGGDPVRLPDRIAADRFTDRDPMAVPAALRVVAWNVEFGKDSAGVSTALATLPALAGADVLLLTEVPRNDPSSVPRGVDLARELARTLRMDYVFAVEWDRREVEPGGGEHGTAILSKYPIGNVRHLRHQALFPYHATTRRLGGRHSLRADLLVGGRPLAVWAVHLDTRDTGGGRALQLREVLVDAAAPDRPAAQLVGGDWNTWNVLPAGWDAANVGALELSLRAALAAGFEDATPGFRSFTQVGLGVLPQRLDWIFVRGARVVPGGRAEPAGASDHLPLWCAISPP